jgi:hypothetical protein
MLSGVSVSNRSRITNGRRHYAPRHGGPDGRSREARRWRDLHQAFVEQLNHTPNAAESVLLRNAADLALASETMSAAIARGEVIDAEELGRMSFALRRTLVLLGLVDGEPGESEVERRRRQIEDREAGLIP